jgi:hypothetical protein
LLDKSCTKLYNVGRYIVTFIYLFDWQFDHCNLASIWALSRPAITAAVSATAFVAALKEYEENSETETDGEDGK